MKKTNYRSQYILFMIVGFLLSCNNDKDMEVTTIQEPSIELKSNYNLLDITPNVYHDYFKQTEHSIGYSSLKANSLSEHSVVEIINIKDEKQVVHLSINSKTIDNFAMSRTISKSSSSDIYGKTIHFKISKEANSMKSTNTSSETEVEMYVPELVKITNPKIESEDNLFPICYYEDFVLEWNADPNNKEGLVVIIEYFGNNAIPQNSTNEHILNTDIIDTDDGHIVLNNDLFKDIPNLSIIHLVLLRGNVTIQEIEGEFYKFFAESHVRLPIILVKDLTTLAKE
ncbi:hypothetical protein [Lutibacter sp.]